MEVVSVIYFTFPAHALPGYMIFFLNNVLLKEGVFKCILFVDFMLCYVEILQARFKLYHRNYFYIIFRICHRAIFCALILSQGCPLGRVTVGGKGLHTVGSWV